MTHPHGAIWQLAALAKECEESNPEKAKRLREKLIAISASDCHICAHVSQGGHEHRPSHLPVSEEEKAQIAAATIHHVWRGPDEQS